MQRIVPLRERTLTAFWISTDTTDHAGIPDIVEDGVNGIVMKNKENAYSKVASFKANELKTVCKRNREYCKEMYTEKRYLHMMETRFKEN